MRLLGCSWLADGPFPIHDSLEVKVSNQTSGHISRSEHVTKPTPGSILPSPWGSLLSAPLATFAQWGLWERNGGGPGGWGCCGQEQLGPDAEHSCGPRLGRRVAGSGEGPSGGDGVRALRVYVAAARARSRRCSRLHVRP